MHPRPFDMGTVPQGLVHEYTLFAFGAGIWNFTGGNEAWYRLMSWMKHSLYSLNWSFSEHTVACVNLTMLCCVVKLSRNQSWVNILFSVPQDLIVNSILYSLFLILDSRFVQESRIANCITNQDSQRTVNFLLNRTVTVWMVDSLMK